MTLLTRQPEQFHGARLLASDFDGTKFLTDEPAPSGIGVSQAYELGLDEVFGPHAADAYRAQGHNSRAPSEIVQACVPDLDEDALDIFTHRVVSAKLRHLLGNIGTPLPDGAIWPRPTAGFLDIWRAVYKARSRGVLIDTADISAGHEEFIKKTYEAWDIPVPDVLVTADTVHQLLLSTALIERVKPAPLPMKIALEKWWGLYELADILEPAAHAALTKRVLYAGDDEHRDGGLARNSAVDFVHVSQGGAAEAWQAVATRLGLGNIALKGIQAR